LVFGARHQSPPPALIAATVRRLQCNASAVTTLPSSAIRSGTSSAASSSPPLWAATVASVSRRRVAEGRHHHPGPRALPLVARATQGHAVNGDHIIVVEQGCDPGQNPTEGGIQRLQIDHPEHRRDRRHATVSHV